MARQIGGFWHDSRTCAARLPVARMSCRGPEGALIPDACAEDDTIAVVYDHGAAPPKITITAVSEGIQTVHADGVAVAIVACAGGPKLTEHDVLLVERFVTA
ncbi:hypothetical protein [uncultured Roseobacter sp.]|uniref:hypothetical protein n=1 Tax=uncultured Roseobacter sp. TaxID=114847 RepID=UPI0026316919|nr:hypothetical protein [uncultured Roseobacter sp.]